MIIFGQKKLKIYRHIFFDLDRTLWDFDTNSGTALSEIFEELKLYRFFTSPEVFVNLYHKHNEYLWENYRLGRLRKETLRSLRFDLTLKDVNVDDPSLAMKIGEQYLELCTEKTTVFPYTFEILNYLSPKYLLYILTNGFRETQFKKLKNTGLIHYFKQIFTSETIGFNKPHPEIFHWAVSSVNARKIECLMIGDDPEVDIRGARSYGMDQVFFNPGNVKCEVDVTYEIKSLIELKNIL